MASAISTYITQLQNAVYGEEVRQAIINSLQRCYDDVNNPTLTKEAFESIISDMASTGSLQEAMLNYIVILTEETSNKFDVIESSIGRLNTTTGELEVELYTNYITSDWIPVNGGDLVYFDWCNFKLFYDTNKEYVGSIPVAAAGATPYTVPEGGGYIRISILNTNRLKASVNIGEHIAYMPGRSSIDHNLRADVYRKSDVYCKSEIDTMMIDYDLTDTQKAELIALLD